MNPSIIRIPADIDRALRAAFDAMSDGDKLTLLELLKHPGAALLTMTETPHGRFWTALGALGWAQTQAIDEDFPGPGARSWAFADGGADKLTAWLRRLLA